MEEKKAGNSGLGIAFITVGLFLLAYRFNLIDGRIFVSFLNLWPLLLIVIGINIIFKRNGWIKFVTWMLFFAALIMYTYYYNGNIQIFGEKIITDHLESEKSYVVYDENIEQGLLKLNLGAGQLEIYSGNQELINSEYPKDITDVTTTFDNENRKVIYNVKNNSSDLRDGIIIDKGYRYDFEINENVIWKFDIDMGAMDANIDLRDILFSDVNIDIGVGQLDLYLDDLIFNSTVQVSTGVSDINIYIPQGQSVKLRYDGGVKVAHFSGGDDYKKDGEYYYSKSYDDNQYYLLNISAGVGDLNIREY
ncbi:MAG: hypothetical protein JW702_07385 [Clostridiales bacterium]|nr:hypothetical protein [Clostridiales bacterium]